MKIKSPSNIELYYIQVDDKSVRYRSIMNDDSLTLYFSLPGTVTIPLGAYVDFEGQRYTLFYPENFKKHNTRNFEYTLTLHGNRELLKRFKFKDTAAIPYRLKFPLTAKPVDFVTRIVQNMNLHDSGWSVGICIDATEKLISFNHESCFDVLGRLAQEFNTEWEIAGKTIHLRKVEKFKADPLALSYGKGNGFKSGTGRMNDGDKIPIGRLYVQGGERNIDFASYGSASLLLPKSATLVYEGKTYRTDAEGMSITRDGNTNIGEESYDGSDIYPKWVGIVSEVIAVDASKNLYNIKDFTIPYSLNFRDCRIPGEKATIVFQSGILAGREFDIEQTEDELTGYIHAEQRFKIVPQEQDGMVMPGGAFIPAVENKYAVFNIRMPQAYISVDATKKGASWDLFREAVKYFSENETQKFQFTGELDGVWSKSRWLQIGGKIVPGGHVLFSDPQFLPGGEVIRIVSVKDYVNSPHKPEITLSNAPVSGSFASGLAKLEADEVVIEQNRRNMIRFAQRQWRDTRETYAMLQNSLLNFSGSINPLTVQTMQLVAGDESLQFRFVNSRTNPQRVDNPAVFNKTNKQLTIGAGILQHMTLGITSISTAGAAKTYKFWDVHYPDGYTSPPLTNPDKAYYLYAKCAKTGATGEFKLSEDAVAMEGEAGYYHFLVGMLNSEYSGGRSFAPMYGYTEILPGRMTVDKIVSQSGKTYFDLVNDVFYGNFKFVSSGGAQTDLAEWAGGIEKSGTVNLLRNSGFTGDYLSIPLSAQTSIDAVTEFTGNKLIHWTNSGCTAAPEPKAASGYACTFGSLSQTIEVKPGEKHTFSCYAKGRLLMNGAEISNTADYAKVVHVFIPQSKTISITGSGTIYDAQIERGIIASDWKPNPGDDHRVMERMLAYNYLTSAIKNGSTSILGGLILTNMIQLGNYKNGALEKVTAGISGVYNDGSDPLIWGGGTLEEAIRRIANPLADRVDENGQPLANFAVDHGGNLFANNAYVRGIIHAVSGFFKGRVEAEAGRIGNFEIEEGKLIGLNSDGGRIELNPENSEIKIYDMFNKEILSIYTVKTGVGINTVTKSFIKVTSYLNRKKTGEIIIGDRAIEFFNCDGDLIRNPGTIIGENGAFFPGDADGAGALAIRKAFRDGSGEPISQLVMYPPYTRMQDALIGGVYVDSNNTLRIRPQ